MNQCSRCQYAYQEQAPDSLEVLRHDGYLGMRVIRYQLCEPCGKMLDDWMSEQVKIMAALRKSVEAAGRTGVGHEEDEE